MIIYPSRHVLQIGLMLAYILSCCTLTIPASDISLTVVPNPPYGTVGSSITLDIRGLSEKALTYVWYRTSSGYHNQVAVYSVPSGLQTPTDIREKVLPNGSLLIPNLTLSDTGDYIVQIADFRSGEVSFARCHLSVYDPLCKPTISSSSMSPVENEDSVTLTCQTSSRDVTFQWLPPNGYSASGRIELSLDNRTLTLHNVTKEDQGPYQCGIWNPVNHILSDPFILNVTREDKGSSLTQCAIAAIVILVLAVISRIVIRLIYYRRTGGQTFSNSSSNSSSNEAEDAPGNIEVQRPLVLNHLRGS